LTVNRENARPRRAARARSDAISGFFICEALQYQKARQGRWRDNDTMFFLKTMGQFRHGDVRLFFDPRDQEIAIGR
jgi:hypothetical protein